MICDAAAFRCQQQVLVVALPAAGACKDESCEQEKNPAILSGAAR